MRRLLPLAFFLLACHGSPTEPDIANATLSGRRSDAVAFRATATSRNDGSYEISLGCPPRPTGTTYVLLLEHPAYERREILSSVPTYSTTFDLLMHRR